MPSKKSKPIRKAQRPSPQGSTSARSLPSQAESRLVWKAAQGCSEADLQALAGELARDLKPGDRVLLEGEMGAGKTTFSRYLLLALKVEQPPEGSPTFAIAHEYVLNQPGLIGVVHVDLYRIRSEEEIDERGIPDYFWDERKIVLCEWTSMWPEFQAQVLKSGRNWRVSLKIPAEASDQRDVQITRPERRTSAR